MHNDILYGSFCLDHIQDRWAALSSLYPRSKHVLCIATYSCGFHHQGNGVFPHATCGMKMLVFPLFYNWEND